jgi:hypothetical protein
MFIYGKLYVKVSYIVKYNKYFNPDLRLIQRQGKYPMWFDKLKVIAISM